MICLIVLALAVFTAPTPATSQVVDLCTARSNRTDWNSPPPGFEWEDAYFGSIPEGAVVGGRGHNGMELYICRTFHKHNLIPGKINSYLGNCDVAWGGIEHDQPLYQVLVNKNHTAVISWVDATDGEHPDNAVVGGYKCDCDKPEGDLSYVGRTNFALSPKGKCRARSRSCFPSFVSFPGKVIQCTNAFHWSYGGYGYKSSTYQIAVWNYVPSTTPPPYVSSTTPVSSTEFTPSSTEFSPSSTEFSPSSTEFSPSSTEFTPSSTEFIASSTEFTPSSTESSTSCAAAGDVPAKYIAAPPGLKWESGYSGGAVPTNAVEGGMDTTGTRLYVCRAYKHNSVIAGKVGRYTSVIAGKVGRYLKACYIPWGGKEVSESTYDVLTKVGDVRIKWEKEANGTHADHPSVVAAGYNCNCDKPDGTINYVGKTEGTISPKGTPLSFLGVTVVFPGNINICHHNFHYAYDGHEYHTKSYYSMWVKKN